MTISSGRRLRTLGSETFSPVNGFISGAKVATTCGSTVGAAVGKGVTVGNVVGLMIGICVSVGLGVEVAGLDDPQAASKTIGIISQTDRITRETKKFIGMLLSVKMKNRSNIEQL